ncbi:hypothetical protein CIB48_g1307 [Xylaria polymorpha]|nr:hypothetical protein CIB48_g1307 [Xylaria polymorpha]
MAPIDDDWGKGPPLSVKEISARAAAFEWNVNIPFKHWLSTSQLLQQQTSFSSISKKSSPILEQQYEAWKEAKAKKKAKLGHHRQSSGEESKELSTYQLHASKDPALSYASRLLDAGENQDLAVELAKKEIQRRDADRRATEKNGETRRGQQLQQQRRTAGFWDTWTQDIVDKQAEDEEVFRRQMESTRRTLDRDTDSPPTHLTHATDRPLKPPSMPAYSYPKIARSAPEVVDRSLLVPERPAKTPHLSESPHELPSRPPKLHDSVPEPPKKQQGVAFKPAAYFENGEPIRPIFLPGQLRRRFLELASENTKRGLEMCGILCGTAVNNALFVRCLLIPEQKCTSDTCETENETTILDYCIEEDLLMLGWIHTHPTQTCFMSSRDLHTQSGYQVMLPESIAIVCAPKFEPSYGIFRLTNPPGLSHILNCTQSSTFHAHSVDNLYTGAEHPPGHVYEHDNLDFYVQDIRPGARNGAVPNKNI